MNQAKTEQLLITIVKARDELESKCVICPCIRFDPATVWCQQCSTGQIIIEIDKIVGDK